jgi:hypothetical protein
MSPHTDTALVVLSVAAAAFYLLRLRLKKGPSTSCSSCSCPKGAPRTGAPAERG